MFEKVKRKLITSSGLPGILAPIEGKVMELRDFSKAASASVNELRLKAKELLVQADWLELESQRADRIADNLEEAVL